MKQQIMTGVILVATPSTFNVILTSCAIKVRIETFF
uniref:Uncharacterized protein n=1 Tax=Arundo donax TaxID=35708 RepID=A0A0A9AGQ0_ARUDO